jgi:hypothetical protein
MAGRGKWVWRVQRALRGRGGGSMGVAVEKMGRYAVNCKKTAACKSRKRSARGREDLEAQEKY